MNYHFYALGRQGHFRQRHWQQPTIGLVISQIVLLMFPRFIRYGDNGHNLDL